MTCRCVQPCSRVLQHPKSKGAPWQKNQTYHNTLVALLSHLTITMALFTSCAKPNASHNSDSGMTRAGCSAPRLHVVHQATLLGLEWKLLVREGRQALHRDASQDSGQIYAQLNPIRGEVPAQA